MFYFSVNEYMLPKAVFYNQQIERNIIFILDSHLSGNYDLEGNSFCISWMPIETSLMKNNNKGTFI